MFEFETPTGAAPEMKAELQEGLDLKVPKSGGRSVFTLTRFKVPGVSKSAGFAFVTKEAAGKFGLHAGIAKGLYVDGDCLIAIGIFRPRSKVVTRPVIRGIQAIFRRTGGACP